MTISEHRVSLCTSFLDDCYEKHGQGPDFWTTDNLVRNYHKPDTQATYSVMYFAKSVGCWWAMRDLVDPPGADPVTNVVSIGAGPQFCILGWFLDRPPADGCKIWALDFLEWDWVTELDSHKVLLQDALAGAPHTFLGGRYFPDEMSPQCVAAQREGRPIRANRFPERSTVLLPMVMNHLLGAHGQVTSTGSLREWFRVIEERVDKIVLVDMPFLHDKTDNFWRAVADLVGLDGEPGVINFQDRSKQFAPCYGERLLPQGQRSPVPESQRRTGLRFPQFCEVSACVFERGIGWRWLDRS